MRRSLEENLKSTLLRQWLDSSEISNSLNELLALKDELLLRTQLVKPFNFGSHLPPFKLLTICTTDPCRNQNSWNYPGEKAVVDRKGRGVGAGGCNLVYLNPVENTRCASRKGARGVCQDLGEENENRCTAVVGLFTGVVKIVGHIV